MGLPFVHGHLGPRFMGLHEHQTRRGRWTTGWTGCNPLFMILRSNGAVHLRRHPCGGQPQSYIKETGFPFVQAFFRIIFHSTTQVVPNSLLCTLLLNTKTIFRVCQYARRNLRSRRSQRSWVCLGSYGNELSPSVSEPPQPVQGPG